jgi:alkylhydroperoxidase family enzyme
VYDKSSLSLREFEAARVTIARINQCAICIDWRTARDVPSRSADPNEVPEAFYQQVGTGDLSGLDEREQLAAEFAERYSTDHLGMDDAFWARLHAHYSDDELVDLALCVASWLALGRFNQVFDIDGACRVPAHR